MGDPLSVLQIWKKYSHVKQSSFSVVAIKMRLVKWTPVRRQRVDPRWRVENVEVLAENLADTDSNADTGTTGSRRVRSISSPTSSIETEDHSFFFSWCFELNWMNEKKATQIVNVLILFYLLYLKEWQLKLLKSLFCFVVPCICERGGFQPLFLLHSITLSESNEQSNLNTMAAGY